MFSLRVTRKREHAVQLLNFNWGIVHKLSDFWYFLTLLAPFFNHYILINIVLTPLRKWSQKLKGGLRRIMLLYCSLPLEKYFFAWHFEAFFVQKMHFFALREWIGEKIVGTFFAHFLPMFTISLFVWSWTICFFWEN